MNCGECKIRDNCLATFPWECPLGLEEYKNSNICDLLQKLYMKKQVQSCKK